MKAIRIFSEPEFERLLEDLGLHAHRALDYWCLWQGLDASVDDHLTELNYTTTFWKLTFRALQDNVLTYLSRLYDQTASALSLGNFLATVKCTAYFSEESFKRRVTVEMHVAFEPLDLAEVENDLMSVSTSDLLVSRLWDLRNRVHFHREANLVRLDSLPSVAGLNADEINILLRRATTIADKYSSLYRRSSIAWLTGWDDYKDLLSLLKQVLSSRAAERDEKLRLLRAGTSAG